MPKNSVCVHRKKEDYEKMDIYNLSALLLVKTKNVFLTTIMLTDFFFGMKGQLFIIFFAT
jgi:hypothetical protein